MTLDRALLADLAARAAMPAERLAAGCRPLPGGDAVIERRLAAWAAAAGRSDMALLRRGLAWRGLDLDALRPMLGPVRWPDDAKLPAWTHDFEALLAEARAVGGQDILGPFAAAAGLRARRRGLRWLGERALLALEGVLLFRLNALCRRILEPSLMLFQRAGGGDFTAAMLAGAVPAFLAGRPVAARLLTLGCDNWVRMVAELEDHLEADMADLERTFHGGRPLGPVVGVEIGDADLHDGNRSVVILEFAAGAKLVHKPRPLHLDAAWAALLDWIGARGFPWPLSSPAVLSRGTHGWAAFVAHRKAADDDELSRFYRRAGGLACLFAVLASGDMHSGNVIAAGGQPVPVDLETVLQPDPRPNEGAMPPGWLAAAMLLPFWTTAAGGFEVDRSGLGATGRPEASHLPFSGGEVDPVLWRHRDDLALGFAAMRRLLLRERDSLPLATLAGQSVRVVKRDTQIYFTLLVQSLGDDALRDGAERFLVLERLAHLLTPGEERRVAAGLVTREQAALAGLDIPRFTMATDGRDVLDGDQVVWPGMVSVSPLDEARQRLNGLREADHDSDVALVGDVVAFRVARLPPSTARRPAGGGAAFDAGHAVDIVAARAEADWRRHAEGRWLACRFLPGARRVVMASGGGFPDLALLLAALWRVTGRAVWRERATDLVARHLGQIGHAASGGATMPGALVSGMGLDAWALAGVAPVVGLDAAGALARALAGRADRRRRPGLDGAAGVLAVSLAGGAPLADCLALGDALRGDVAGLGAGGLLTGLDGLGLALGRLGRVSGEPRFAEAAQRALAAADAARAPQPCFDWADGMAGFAAARLVAGGDPSPWLDRLAAAEPAPLDGLCVGNAGEIDVLVEGARLLGRPDWQAAAARRGAALLGRPWRFFDGPAASAELFDLANGAAGVGYTLLRLAAPGRLPSLALLEGGA